MIYDLLIIGGGPAGIAAGIYGARKALKVLLLTKDFIGQIGRTGRVENYPGFPEISGPLLMQKFKEHLKKFPIEVKEGEGVKSLKKKDFFEVETIKGEKFQSRAVIVASGRSPRYLQIPGEKEFLGQGVSYCSTCDALFFKNKTVAVIGGGNAGFEAVLDLLPYAVKVYVLELGDRLNADEVNRQKAEASGRVEILLRTKALAIKGREKVESLVCQNLDNGQPRELSLEGVFISVGSLPAVDFLKDLVEFNQQGEVIVDRQTGQTNVSGLFAAGDVTDVKYKQVGVAVGEGIKALLSAYEYLKRA